MSQLLRRSATNPTLRKLYRRTKTIAKHAPVGHKIMCPCGCLQEFKKKTDTQIFAKSEKDTHKNRYYTRTRSSSNYIFDQKMLMIESKMKSYINKNEYLIPSRKAKKTKPEEFNMNVSNNEFSSEALIEIMKQNKSINKNKKVGEKMLCPCSCGESIIKGTYQQAYAESKVKSHKDNYYNIVRGDVIIEATPENKKIFDIMKDNVSKEIENIKNEEKKPKKRARARLRR